MARFRGTVQGARGKASRLGHAKTGLVVECNGWHKGVRVEAGTVDGKDVFYVYETTGSSPAGNARLVLKVKEED